MCKSIICFYFLVENCIEALINHIENFQQNTDKIVKGESYQEAQNLDDVVVESEEITSTFDSNTHEIIVNQEEPKNLGAIPKTLNNKFHEPLFVSSKTRPLDFSSILKQDSREFIGALNKQTTKKKQSVIDSKDVKRIIENIKWGYKIMIIMRGVPGCGKSYLARYILDQSVGNDYRNHIFSSDDYFYNIKGEYVYQKEKIQEAHEYNQKRVRKKAAEGWSPIIVDNTNIKIWEMFPYVKVAVQYGYIIEILKPNNEWSKSPGILAAKNKHGVPKDKIQRMLMNFEPVTVDELIKVLNFIC